MLAIWVLGLSRTRVRACQRAGIPFIAEQDAPRDPASLSICRFTDGLKLSIRTFQSIIGFPEGLYDHPSVDRLMGLDAQSAAMPNDATDAETGRFVSKYEDEDFLAALETLGEAGTRAVADEVGCNRDTARVRLTALAEQGDIERREIAGAILWSLAVADESADPDDRTEVEA
jgi:hypothetical protein